MKIFNTLLILFLSSSFLAQATVHTVDNKLDHFADFTTIQAAVSAAADGDTIYVNPSPNSYTLNTFQIYKKVILLGGMANSNYSPDGYTSIFSGNMAFESGSAGSVVAGFVSGGKVTVANGADSITIAHCRLDEILIGFEVNDILIYNNTLYELIGPGDVANAGSNIQIRNNYFWMAGFGTGIQGIKNAYFSHNLFRGDNTSNSSINFRALRFCYNSIFENNVFVSFRFYPLDNPSVCFNCAAHNNVNYFVSGSGVSGVFLPDDNGSNYTNNINTALDLNPYEQDISAIYLLDATDLPLSYPAGSPLPNAGTDGTDIGILGGLYPIDPITIMGSPLPYIIEVEALNGDMSTIPVSTGSFPVNIKAVPGRQ